MKYVDKLLIYTDQSLFSGTSLLWYDRQTSMVRNLFNTSMSLQFTEYDCKLTMGAPYQQHNNMAGGFICIQMNSSQPKIGNIDFAWTQQIVTHYFNISNFVAVNIRLTLPHTHIEWK